MKRISLEELLEKHPNAPYQQQYAYVMDLLGQGKLKPVKSAGTNGKKPALCLSYWQVNEEGKSLTELEEELKFRLETSISVSYYLSHLEEYKKDRPWVQMLNTYLKENRHLLEQPVSVNERSFEIWNREKFLTREQGPKILKRCGLEPDFFHMYETAEPFAYYSNTRDTPQNLLILENKDTFFSMRKFLLEGGAHIFGMETGTLIYGAGKRIVKSFRDFSLSAEPYMEKEGNRFFYFGDLDYEGIIIYESLAAQPWPYGKIAPFAAAYQAMLAKAEKAANLPDAKESQNQHLSGAFFTYFSKETTEQMQEILAKGQYIPQEILNIRDFMLER